MTDLEPFDLIEFNGRRARFMRYDSAGRALVQTMDGVRHLLRIESLRRAWG